MPSRHVPSAYQVVNRGLSSRPILNRRQGTLGQIARIQHDLVGHYAQQASCPLLTVGLSIGYCHTMIPAKPFWWPFATLINFLSSSVQDAAPVL
ncbi:MAG: hypothetical protein O6948_04220 [Deltaproteobacteria bacterium]|nr:hypothetical protein [Deltaproteobacteria bacterium]